VPPPSDPWTDLRWTAPERVLVHLADFGTGVDGFAAPPEITIDGVALATGLRPSHASRALKKLRTRGLVVETDVRLSGAKRRRKGYLLSWKGLDAARRLMDSVMLLPAVAILPGGTRIEAPVGKLREALARETGATPRKGRLALMLADGRGHVDGGDLSADVARASSGRFVGREAEMRAIDGCLRALARGAGSVILVSGEAGVGKSRLVREALARHRKVLRILAGRCLDRGAVPFLPFREALGKAFPRAPAALATGRAEDLERERETHFFLILEQLSRASAAGTVIFIDDLHWADPSSLGLAHYIARATVSAPIALIATVRSEETGPAHAADSSGIAPLRDTLARLERERLVTHVSLGPLPRADASELVADRLGEGHPEGLRELVLEKGGGNPLYLEEAVRAARVSLPDLGQWRTLKRRWRTPPTIMGLVESRLARLEPADREVAVAAAVLGRADDLEILAGMSSRGLEETVASVDRLVAVRLFEERDGSTVFAHPAVPAAIVESLSEVRRAFLHRRALEALESRAGPGREIASEAAAHASEAGLHARAFTYLLEAAVHAEASRAHETAAAACREARQLVERHGAAALGGAGGAQAATPADAERALLEKEADAWGISGMFGEAEEAERLLAERAAPGAPRAEHLLRRADYLVRQGRPDDALKTLDRAEAEARAADSVLLRGRAAGGRSVACYLVGRLAEAKAHGEEYLKAAESASSPADFAEASRAAATATYLLGDVDGALALYRRGLVVAAEAGEESKVRRLKHGVGSMLLMTGRPAEAARELEETREMAERAGDTAVLINTLVNLTAAYQRLGRATEAVSTGERGRAAAERTGNLAALVTCRNNLGVAALSAGDLGRAAEEFRASIDLCDRSGVVYPRSRPLGNLAEVEVLRGRLPEARALAERAVREATVTGDPVARAEAEGALALVEMAGDQPAKGVEMFAAAVRPLLAPGLRSEGQLLVEETARRLDAIGRGKEAEGVRALLSGASV
jgi:tetratricopeptide (TPR) repeat protein